MNMLCRSLCVTASLLPELMHSLDATLSLLLRCHLDLLAGRGLDGASRSMQHTDTPAGSISGVCCASGTGGSLLTPHADVTGLKGSPDRSAVSEDRCVAVVERMCGFARMVAALCGTEAGCNVLLRITGVPCALHGDVHNCAQHDRGE